MYTQLIEYGFFYNKTTPSDINEHLETLKRYAEVCNTVTEMGVRSVVSTWAFLAARPKKLTSIDIEECPIGVIKELAIGVGVDFKFILADTRSIVIEQTDLLFIDTWHVYDQLKIELDLHGNKANKFIIMHDTTIYGENGDTPGYKGLWPAVEEFLVLNNNWRLKERHHNCNGLTVLERVG